MMLQKVNEKSNTLSTKNLRFTNLTIRLIIFKPIFKNEFN